MNVMVNKWTGENAITAEDGQSVYNQIMPELQAKRTVELDFAGVTAFASPFFNTAIGQLLKDFPPEDLNHLLVMKHLPSAGSDVLKLVIENCKKYYASPDYREAQMKVLRELAQEDE